MGIGAGGISIFRIGLFLCLVLLFTQDVWLVDKAEVLELFAMRFEVLTALLSAATLVSGLFVPRASNGTVDLPSLLDADLEDLVTGLESGAFTSVDLVHAYTARIVEVNETLHMVSLHHHGVGETREQD